MPEQIPSKLNINTIINLIRRLEMSTLQGHIEATVNKGHLDCGVK